jgi:uncharacterized membrane protein YhhN
MNKTYRALISTLYLIVLAIDCLLILNKSEEYRLYTKPLLMPLLYILMAVQTSEGSHRRSKLILTFAIFLSFGGDFVLLYDSDKSYFMLGLICFLLALISYSLFFLRLKHLSTKRIISLLVTAVVVIAYMYLLLSNLWSGITDQGLEAPVIIYSAALGFLLFTAINTSASRRIRKVAYQNFIPGAILFIVSDSFLAINKFAVMSDKTHASQLHIIYLLTIIVSYGLAQLLLVSGAVRIIGK